MRNLIIRREKSFVACINTMKVYIEDNVYGNTTICGVRCRKLGVLKNGTEAVFQIEDHAAKVFVIAGATSKWFCNDFFQLMPGTEDVFLVGKNCFNPATGNAFRFYNNYGEGVAENRKRCAIKGTLFLVGALLVGVAIGVTIGYSLSKRKFRF